MGDCEFGQLGIGTKQGHKVPQFVQGLKGEKVMMLESGLDHNLALTGGILGF